MKIIIACHTYYPDKNGVQLVTQYIAEGLAIRNDVLIISETREGTVQEEKYHNVSIKRINVKLCRHKFWGEKRKFFNLIQSFKPDVLVCVCTQSWPFDWTKGALKKLHCKTVLYTHGFSAYKKHYPLIFDLCNLHLRAFESHLYWKVYYYNAFKYMRKYDLITYLSKANSSYLYAKEHYLSNGMILENAVEDKVFSSSSLKNIDKNKELQYIYIANYDDNKNHKMVLQAFAAAKIPEAKLVLIGGQKNLFYAQLVAMKDEYELENVEIRYGRSRNEIYGYFAQSDVFVCGSKHEEYPIMLCEAAAAGLAIISTDIGHVRYMPGSIVVTDLKEMKEAIKYLNSNKEERFIRGEKLYDYAEKHYRIQDKVKRFEDKLMELTEGK